jgi:hypothetical protein
MLSKCSVNDRRKFDIIVVTLRLYNAGGRQVYHITINQGLFSVVGMGMEQHGMGGIAQDKRRYSIGHDASVYG